MSILLLILTFLPILCSILIKVFFMPASTGIEISGAYIYFTIDLPLGGLPITESQVNSWAVVLSLFFFCLFLTRGLRTTNISKRQVVAEWIVEKIEGLVRGNMGEYFAGFAPFVAAVIGLSAMSSLQSLFGLYPATSDLNVVGGWALLVFILITYYKMKAGPAVYLKSFADPVPFLAPLNLVGEIATPVSMALRHYGNVISGLVISVLISAALGGLSEMVFGWLPGILSGFPLFRFGIPAVFSIYFDIFSGCLQAYIFAMLTMLYISSGFPEDEYFRRKAAKKAAKMKNGKAE